jgi:hypothetical protein
LRYDKILHPRAIADCLAVYLRSALRAAPDYADAIFNLALLLQRNDQHSQAAEHARVRARRVPKVCGGYAFPFGRFVWFPSVLLHWRGGLPNNAFAGSEVLMEPAVPRMERQSREASLTAGTNFGG